ncbi:MAG: hypothetical protein JWQ78_1051 [Sediminibacterium sp.]|nr:hypothetical protein [Sediminibacterium sp.]
MAPFNKEIWIHNDSLVSEVQSAFTGCYPFLKIDFLKTDTDAKTLRSSKIDPRTHLKKLAKLPGTQKMDIDQNKTVSEITHDFEHMLGVIVLVSRKSGNVWSTISVTEGWTLEAQNSAGEFISSQMSGME